MRFNRLSSVSLAAVGNPARPMLRIGVVVAAYTLAGFLSVVTGMVVRGPTGVSATVWLPPGIALAALLMWGKRNWPGVLVGALLLNVLMSYLEAPQLPWPQRLLLDVLISSGVVAQALTACALVRRFDPMVALDQPRTVLRFLLCSVFAAALSSSAGSWGCVLVGVRSYEDLSHDWPSWWVSDIVGVFLATPVVLAWVAEPAHIWRPRRFQLSLPLFVALVLVAIAFVQANKLEGARERDDFEQTAEEIAADLADELDVASEGAHAVRDFIDFGAAQQQRGFHAFASRLRERNRALATVSWIPYVPKRDRQAYETRQRVLGLNGFSIYELGPDLSFVVAGDRPEYFPVELAEPDSVASRLIGLDIASLPGRRQLFDESRQSTDLTMSGLVDLRVFTQDHGVLMVLPAQHLRGELRGFVVCAIRIADVMHNVLTPHAMLELDVELRDMDGPRGPQLLYSSTAQHLRTDQVIFRATRDFRHGGRRWQLDLRPTLEYLRRHRYEFSAAVSVVGLAFSALLCAFLLVTSGRSANIARQVTDRTRELSKANSQLRDEIATHKRTEQALKESELRWQFALEEAGDGLWDWDVARDHLFWSPRMLQVLGYAANDQTGDSSSWTNTVHPDDFTPTRAQLEEHLSGRSPGFTGELRLRRGDGSWIWFLTRAKVVVRDAEGKPLRVIGTQTDIEERKRAEQELKAHREQLEHLVSERTAELEVAKAAAEEANRAKSLFLANMSHELRTPMHAVLAYARLGLDRQPPPKLAQFLKRIVDSGERLLLLLNDLLDLSKLEAGKMHIEPDPHDLEAIMRDVALEIEPLLATKKLAFDLERAPDCQSCVAQVDRKLVTQLFHNILANAVRFSSEGGRLSARFAYSQLPGSDAGATRAALEIAIRDEGIGIPEDELELIFDKFVQSSKTRTNAGGTGLGLAICRQIVELHLGTMRARNNPERGATFVVTLPLQVRSNYRAGEAA